MAPMQPQVVATKPTNPDAAKLPQASILVPAFSRPQILAQNVSALFRRPRDFVAADVEKLLQFEAVLRTREFFGRNTHDQDFRGILEECLLAAFLGCFYHFDFPPLSVCEYRPENGLSFRSREDMSIRNAKSVGSRLRMKSSSADYATDAKADGNGASASGIYVKCFKAVVRAEPKQSSSSSSNSRTSSRSSNSGVGAVSRVWGFVSNGTSAPVSGPFSAEAFRASNSRGDPPPHIRDAPHRARACASLDWREKGLAESNVGQGEMSRSKP